MDFRTVVVPVVTDRGSVFACSENRFAILAHQTREIISINPKLFRSLNLERFRKNDSIMFSYGKDGSHATIIAIFPFDDCPEQLHEIIEKSVELKIPIVNPKKFESESNTKDPNIFYKTKK